MESNLIHRCFKLFTKTLIKAGSAIHWIFSEYATEYFRSMQSVLNLILNSNV